MRHNMEIILWPQITETSLHPTTQATDKHASFLYKTKPQNKIWMQVIAQPQLKVHFSLL